MLVAVSTQEYILYSSRPVKLYEVLPLGTVMVTVVPLLSVRTRLYVEMLLDGEGATHMMVMVVVPVDVTLTDVGGSGRGGATEAYISSLSSNYNIM